MNTPNLEHNPHKEGTGSISPSLLLEIGTEEIPARFLPGAVSDLKQTAVRVFDEYRIGYTNIRSFATPRRLALIIDGIPFMQNDIIKEVLGPSKNTAFDKHGEHTKAAHGFANSLGINVSDLKIAQKGKGEYIAAVIKKSGLKTKSVLPEVLKKIILALHFPKTMRWGHGNFSFVRPIHWILSIFDSEIIDFELDKIKSSNVTMGHRFLSPAAFKIKDILSYMNLLENNFVILDNEKRKNYILNGIKSLLENSDLMLIADEDLLDVVNFLVEFPVPVLCSFNRDYLKLPKELLITVMKDHQKYFSVQDKEGNLSNNFIVISNTKSENSETVRVGAERVIKARFDDANFYFLEDLKKPLSENIEYLKQVMFHDSLGTLFDKTKRLVSVSAFLSEKTNPSIKDKVIRAASLSKTDLITGVVREFPELQGIMGKYYSSKDKEDSEISAALEEQYLPKSFGDKLPKTEVGAILSLSDKIDNITSFFSIGIIPTGSEDPFAIRRQAAGIVSIILDRRYELTLEEIFKTALKNLQNVKSDENTLKDIISFMEQRTEYILSYNGFPQDIIKSVLHLSSANPLKAITGRIDALSKFRNEPVFPDFILAMKRVNNIIPKTSLSAVKTELFSLDEEKNLYKHLSGMRDNVKQLADSEQFFDALKILSGITQPINNFFDRVLVMDKQEEIKTNRLALLKEIWHTASVIADFSKLI